MSSTTVRPVCLLRDSDIYQSSDQYSGNIQIAGVLLLLSTGCSQKQPHGARRSSSLGEHGLAEGLTAGSGLSYGVGSVAVY